MSYSVSVTKATKDELLVALRNKLAEVVTAQPVHEADIDQASDAAKSFIALMNDDPSKNLTVSVSGSIWKVGGDVNQVSLQISIGYSLRDL